MSFYKSALCLSLTSALLGCGGSTETSVSADSSSAVAPAPAVLPAKPVFSSQPDAVTQQPYAEFSFSSADAQSYTCQLNAEPEVSCSSPFLLFPLDVQQHSLLVRAVSADSKVSEPAVVSWTVSSIFADESLSTVHADLIATSVQPEATNDNSWRGILRINCDLSHSGYNDPIVYPGQKDAAHLHRFYGNTLLDENSDITSLFTSGESSCQGNELNRSAYWVPALLAPLYDLQTNERQVDEQGEPAWQIVPAVVGNDDEAHEVFYYSAGVDDLSSIQPIPLGLKMIAGSAMGMPGMEQDTSIVRWHCQSWESSDASNPRWSSSIPECVAPDRLRMDIFFPSCWNGTDLDSADHKSHLAYPVNNGGPNGTVCPASHPVPIIRVSFHYAYGVKPEVYDPQSRSSRGWRFASDMYEVSTTTPGGMSLHGDWFNAWHPEALQAVLDGCIVQQLDCHDGNLANGYRLSGTRAGSQNEVPIVNKGLGY
uniref:Putative secreted protein n=1 Tax=Rheinheimera sp. BAL341 TaxID=1708203 RepID=A0A486XPJ7_9GAMM